MFLAQPQVHPLPTGREAQEIRKDPRTLFDPRVFFHCKDTAHGFSHFLDGTYNKGIAHAEKRIRSDMPVLVHSSSKPWIRSASTGVRRRRRLVSGSSMTWVLRLVVLSLVSMVRAGRSKGSGKAMGPSENTYLCPFRAVRSIFLAPLRYSHYQSYRQDSIFQERYVGQCPAARSVPFPSVLIHP